LIDKASEPTLTYRIWKERREQEAERERARKELEEADREFLAFKAREEKGAKRGVQSAFGKKLLAKHAEAQKRMAMAGNGESVATQAMAAGGRGDGEEERLVGGQAETVRATKKKGFRMFFSGVTVAQEAKAQKGKTRLGLVMPGSASAVRIRDRDEEELVGGEPEVGVQMRVPVKRTTWGSEAPPPYSSLPTEDHEHEDDFHSDTGR
jgi:hypothetical protein